MSNKNRVGQSASNAIRSYNRIVQNVTDQCAKFGELGEVLQGDLHMAVIYSTKDGFVRFLGSKTFTSVLEHHGEELMEQLRTNSEICESNFRQEFLPKLPAPVSQLNAKSLQKIIPFVMRNLKGGGYIRWNRASCKPQWWPESVVFTNVKQRPKEQPNDGRTWSDCLREIVTAMYNHHGYDAEAHFMIEDETDETQEEVQQRPPVQREIPEEVQQPPQSPIQREIPEAQKRPQAPVQREIPTEVQQRPRAPVQREIPEDVQQRPQTPTQREILEGKQRPQAPVQSEIPEVQKRPQTPVQREIPKVQKRPQAPVQRKIPTEVQQRTQVPVQTKAPAEVQQCVQTCTPARGRKRTFGEYELSLTVNEWVENANRQTPKKRRKVKPRNVFTPSNY